MSRPLIQRGIADLEALFARSKTEIKVLKQLEHELQHRQMPRALALLAEVRSAIHGATPRPASTKAEVAPQQKGLWEQPTTLVVVAPITAPAGVEPFRAPVAQTASKKGRDVAPSMTLEDAYKLLRASSGSAWESIEQARRQLVQRSTPARLKTMSAEQRDQALEEARMINAAYEALSQARCSRDQTQSTQPIVGS